VGPRWDAGAPLPHMVSNGSRAFVVCLASQRDPQWDGTDVPEVSPADACPRNHRDLRASTTRDCNLNGLAPEQLLWEVR
jgi:hypothetical protein